MKTAIIFLVITSILLQIFSAFVSFYTISNFIEAYIQYTSILVLFSIIVVVLIEVGIRTLADVVFNTKLNSLPRIVIGTVWGLLLLFSMFLTTISPARIAVKNVTLEPLQQRSINDLTQIELQLESDREALNTLLNSINARKYKAPIEAEQRSISELQDRISVNNKIISDELNNRNLSNQVIKSRNNTIIEETKEVHNNFGFITQIVLAACLFSIFLLNKELLNSLPKNKNRQRSDNENQEDCNTPATPMQPQTTPKKNRQNISPDLVAKIAQFKKKGLSHGEIAKELGINKSTVTRALQNIILEYCNNGEIKTKEGALEALQHFGIQWFDDLPKF